MSTKIYQAWRAPLGHIVDIIDWARETMMTAAKDQMELYMAAVKQEKLGDIPKHIKGDLEGERVWERNKRLDCVMEIIKEEAKSPYRSAFNLQCGINVWVHKGYVYIIPIGEYFITEKMEQSLPEWMEDFSYWNNTDPPEDVSDEEWENRKETWNKICIGSDKASHNARRLYHEVIDPSNSMGCFDLEWNLARKDMFKWADRNRKK